MRLQDRLLRLVTMRPLPSAIKPASPEFERNRSKMAALLAELHEREAAAAAGGGAQAVARHRELGKLPVRDRVARLVDPGTPVLELSPLAAWDHYDNDAPGA